MAQLYCGPYLSPYLVALEHPGVKILMITINKSDLEQELNTFIKIFCFKEAKFIKKSKEFLFINGSKISFIVYKDGCSLVDFDGAVIFEADQFSAEQKKFIKSEIFNKEKTFLVYADRKKIETLPGYFEICHESTLMTPHTKLKGDYIPRLLKEYAGQGKGY